MKSADLRNRVLVGSFALLIAAGGIVAAVSAFRSGSTQPSPRSTDQPAYEVTFPSDPTPVNGQMGSYSITLTSNLPEGTLVDVEYSDVLGEGGGCCTSFAQGAMSIPLVNNHCVEKQGSDVTIHVIAAPDYSNNYFGPQGVTLAVPTQPDSVTKVLGANFENLNGPDVVVEGSTRVLDASHEYQLPPDTCVSPTPP